VGPEILAIALAVINILKRRFWPVAVAVLLLPVILVAILAGNEGPFAEEASPWLIAFVIVTPLAVLLATLLMPALRLAKPDSWQRSGLEPPAHHHPTHDPT